MTVSSLISPSSFTRDEVAAVHGGVADARLEHERARAAAVDLVDVAEVREDAADAAQDRVTIGRAAYGLNATGLVKTTSSASRSPIVSNAPASTASRNAFIGGPPGGSGSRRTTRWRRPRPGCRRAARGTGRSRRRRVRSGRGRTCARSARRRRAGRRARRGAARPGRRSTSRSPRCSARSLTANSLRRRLRRGGCGQPVGELVAAVGGDGVDLLVRPAGLRDEVGLDELVGLHPAQHLVDLLVAGPPEVADRGVEAARQVVAARGPLRERHENRVLECHGPGPYYASSCYATRCIVPWQVA